MKDERIAASHAAVFIIPLDNGGGINLDRLLKTALAQRRHSDDTKAKISATQKARWQARREQVTA
jgi:hypothetical protein